MVSFAALASAIAETIIVATREVHITGVTPAEADALFIANGKPNRVYRHNAYCVASCVILWPGVVASFARLVAQILLRKSHGIWFLTNLFPDSAYIMWKSINHNDIYGPKSTKYRSSSPIKGEEASLDLPAAKPEATTGPGPTR